MMSNNLINDLDSLTIATSVLCNPEECILNIGDTKNCLTIVSLNIRSIYKNLAAFESFLCRLKFKLDVIILTECWLHTDKNIPTLDGYVTSFTKNYRNQNDGVVAYISEEITHSVEEIFSSSADFLVIKLRSETAIVCIYRSPSLIHIEDFLVSLEEVVKTLNYFPNIIVTGDVNLDIKNNPMDAKVSAYLNLTAELGLLPAHTLRTRGNNCLDHFFLKTNLPSFVTVVNTQITDHLPVILSINKHKPNINSRKSHIKTDWSAVLAQIKLIDYESMFESDDADIVTDLFISSISNIIKSYTKQIFIRKKDRTIKPWITPGILRCIRTKDKLHTQYKLNPRNLTFKITYLRYQKKCSQIIFTAKNNYDKSYIANSLHSPKATWKAIKDMTYSPKNNPPPNELLLIKNTPQESVDYVNNFFASVGSELAHKILVNTSSQPTPSITAPSYFNTATPHNSLVVLPTDEAEIKTLIMDLKSDSATGWDGIPSRLLKDAREIISYPLSKLLNLCIEKGTFPRAFKKSIIIPIHKSGDKQTVSNYRPISILPALSKIFEKVLNVRLMSFLNKYDLLANEQYGFRAARSTEDAVINLCNTVSEALDRKSKCIGVFLDLAKAFDTVSIPKLVKKLNSIGIRGNCLKLFSDFLALRTQMVKVGEHKSKEAEITYGVPQGSILGPSLFLIYINDLCSMKLPNANIFAYADDTAIVFQEETWQLVFRAAECGLATIKHWLNSNLLTLNTDKTQYITFSMRHNNDIFKHFNLKAHCCHNIPPINCNCPLLSRTTSLKYLGVMLDEHLRWMPHITLLSSRIRKLTWIFKKLRNALDTDLLASVYIAICQSVQTYCITAWGGTYKTHMILLERAQRSVIKVMTFKKYRYPTRDLYHTCKLLTIRQLYILRVILRKHSKIPLHPNHIRKKRRIHITNPSCRTTFMQHQFEFLSNHLYNKINKILNISKINSFSCKQVVKNWLQKLSYNDTEELLQIQR